MIVVVSCYDSLPIEEERRLRNQIAWELPGRPIIILPPGVSGIELMSFPDSEDAMSKTEVLYACPACGRDTNKATVTKGYTPTVNDLALRPEMRAKSDELLTCPCGRLYTWFSAQQVTVRDQT